MNKVYLCILFFVSSCALEPSLTSFRSKRATDASKPKPNEEIKSKIDMPLVEIPQSNLDMKKTFTFTSGNMVYLVDSQGFSLPYNMSDNVFLSSVSYPEANRSDTIFYFPNHGYIALTDTDVEYFLEESKLLLNRARLGDVLDVKAVYPGNLLYRANGESTLEYVSQNGIESISIKNADFLEESTFFGACKAECILWKMENNRLYTSVSRDDQMMNWEETGILIEGIDSKNLKSIHVNITGSAKSAIVEEISGLTKDDKLVLFSSQSKANPSEYTWPDIKDLSQEFCSPCHRVDGFDSEETWIRLKDEIIARLDGRQGLNPMPPIESKWGNDMQETQKKGIIDFLSGK